MRESIFLYLTQPTGHSTALSTLTAENAFLRQQLITIRVQRQIKKTRFTQSDRFWLVFLASRVQHWKDTLLILKPETVLLSFRLNFWDIRRFARDTRETS